MFAFNFYQPCCILAGHPSEAAPLRKPGPTFGPFAHTTPCGCQVPWTMWMQASMNECIVWKKPMWLQKQKPCWPIHVQRPLWHIHFTNVMLWLMFQKANLANPLPNATMADMFCKSRFGMTCFQKPSWPIYFQMPIYGIYILQKPFYGPLFKKPFWPIMFLCEV